MHGCSGFAAGPEYRPATREELGFLKATGAIGSFAAHAMLISVAKAVRVCAKAEVAAPLLAAISGIAELQPYSAPLPHAHPHKAPQSGVACFSPHACASFVKVEGYSLLSLSFTLQGRQHLPSLQKACHHCQAPCHPILRLPGPSASHTACLRGDRPLMRCKTYRRRSHCTASSSVRCGLLAPNQPQTPNPCQPV